MSDRAYANVQAQQKTVIGSSSKNSLLQRTCACGQHTIAGGECSTCRSEQSTLHRSQRAFEPQSATVAVQGNSPAQENGTSLNSAFDRASRFGHDFSRIPIYTSTAGVIQTKLAINKPGDEYEREADRIADQVLAAPANLAASGAPPRIQRFIGQAPEPADTAPASVDHILANSGRSLDPALRQDMEQRFGHDFSHVRVHSGAAAEQSAREMHANAYTVDHNIVFGAGRFTPGTVEGRRLIAHELTHVVQQAGADGMSVGPSNERSGLSAVPRVSPVSRSSGGASVPVVQCKHPESTETTEATGSEAMWSQVIGEHSTAVGNMARVKAPLGVRLRFRPAPGAPNEVILPFDELVRVERKTDYGWCWVVSMDKYTGKTGFCEEQFLSIDPPEPTAHLYQVQPNETLGAIATRRYGKSMDEENNARLYVQALYIANKDHAGVYLDEVDLGLSETLLRSGREEEALKIYKGAKVRKGLAIWVPSEEFIQQLKAQGLITSGSTEVMKVWRKAKKFVSDVFEGAKYVAGFIVGLLEGAWKAIVDLFKGAADMIKTVAEVFYNLITGNPGAIKDMLMGWVKKLKDAWEKRGQIYDLLTEKWNAKDGWDRGRFQGGVLGWLLMTVLILIVTLGEGAIEEISGTWKLVVDVLKLTQKAGDLGTYVSAATRSLGKAGAVITNALRASGLGKVVTVAETVARPIVWTAEFVKKALKLPPRIASELTEAVAKRLQIFGEGALERISKMKDWVKSWLFGCNSPCDWNPDRVLEELKHTDDEIEKHAAESLVTHGERPSGGEPQTGVRERKTGSDPVSSAGRTPVSPAAPRADTVEEFQKRGGEIEHLPSRGDPRELALRVERAHDIGVRNGRAYARKTLGLKGTGFVNPFEKSGKFGQGFDDIMVKGSDLETGIIYIVEYKGGSAALAEGQMELEWVAGNIRRLFIEGGEDGQILARKLARALREGRLKGVALSTPLEGNIAKVTEVLDRWDYTVKKLGSKLGF